MSTALALEVHLSMTYDAALEHVAAALKREGFGIITQIDVRHTLQEKLGEDFRPYAILGACNPSLAHRALAREALAGLLLPCNVTVEEDPDGGAVVRVADPEAMLSVGDLSADAVLCGVAAEAKQKLRRVVQDLAG